MAEEFGFYDPVLLPDGTYDREYNAKNFSVPFNALINTGVMKGEMNELAVTNDGLGMITKIDTGIAFINGRYYKNTSFKTHQHDTESVGVSRIDRIVIRMNEETDYRSTLSYVKKGAPSANPVPPALIQTESIYEISLAQVKIVGGQTFIAVNAVTDERGKAVICPWAGSNILPNFNENTVLTKLDNHISNEMIHVPFAQAVFSSETGYDLYTVIAPEIKEYKLGTTIRVLIPQGNNRTSPRIKINDLAVVPLVPTRGQMTQKWRIQGYGVYTLTYAYGEFQFSSDSVPYSKVLVPTSPGWSEPWVGSINAYKVGDFVHVIGAIKVTSASAYRQMCILPDGYINNGTLTPFSLFLYNTSGAQMMGSGVISGGGGMEIISHTAAQLSLTQTHYFAATFLIPR